MDMDFLDFILQNFKLINRHLNSSIYLSKTSFRPSDFPLAKCMSHPSRTVQDIPIFKLSNVINRLLCNFEAFGLGSPEVLLEIPTFLVSYNVAVVE